MASSASSTRAQGRRDAEDPLAADVTLDGRQYSTTDARRTMAQGAPALTGEAAAVHAQLLGEGAPGFAVLKGAIPAELAGLAMDVKVILTPPCIFN